MIKQRTIFIGLGLTLLTLIGFKLRSDGYRSVPLPGQSTDEYSNAWVGMSLIQTGMPVGISGLQSGQTIDYRYLNPDHLYNSGATSGDPMAISYPWFDHPPLMPLIVGGWTHLNGARVFEDVTASVVRQPALVLGTLLIPFVFILAYLEFGLIAAVLAALAVTVSPLMVINSRMSQAEIFIAPAFVANLILLKHYFSTKQRWWLWLAALIGGLALLTKLSGVAMVVADLVLVWLYKQSNEKKLQQSLILASPALAALLFYFALGLSINGSDFINVFTANAGRKYGIGFNAVYELITQTRVTNLKYLTDGWFLAGWLGLAAILARKRGQMISMAIIAYLAVYLLFGSEPYGWYRIPFLPFLLISLGVVVAQAFRRSSPLTLAVLVLLIPLGVNLSKLYSAADPKFISLFRYGNVLALGLVLLALILGKSGPGLGRRLSRVLVIGLAVLAFLTSLWYTQSLNLANWYQAS